MTLQQLEYLIALDTHRQFVSAADECGVSQPTLSMMISKLEKELDVSIFDRSKQPIEPTDLGVKIIEQARTILRESRKVEELIYAETHGLEGILRIGVIPTLAPYLIPEFIEKFVQKYPEVDLRILELQTDTLIDYLREDRLDMFIAATPLDEDHLYEIPLYYEKFVAYFSPNHPLSEDPLSSRSMPNEDLWILDQGHCLRDQVFNICNSDIQHHKTYLSGSIDTLIRIVDQNGGYTVIPELHTVFLSKEQKKNLRSIDFPPAVREVSLVIHRSYVREKLLNAVSDTIQSIIPEQMIDTKLKKYSIRLK